MTNHADRGFRFVAVVWGFFWPPYGRTWISHVLPFPVSSEEQGREDITKVMKSAIEEQEDVDNLRWQLVERFYPVDFL